MPLDMLQYHIVPHLTALTTVRLTQTCRQLTAPNVLYPFVRAVRTSEWQAVPDHVIACLRNLEEIEADAEGGRMITDFIGQQTRLTTIRLGPQAYWARRDLTYLLKARAAGLSRLQTLELRVPPPPSDGCLGDWSYSAVVAAAAPSLTSLTINEASSSPTSFDPSVLLAIPGLTHLSIGAVPSHQPAYTAVLRDLATRLTSLTVWTDMAVVGELVTQSTTLRFLNLHTTRYFANFSYIRPAVYDFPSLTALSFGSPAGDWGMGLTPGFMAMLGPLPALRSLSFRNPGAQLDLRALAAFTTLRHLTIEGHAYPALFTHLGRLTGLQRLDLCDIVIPGRSRRVDPGMHHRGLRALRDRGCVIECVTRNKQLIC